MAYLLLLKISDRKGYFVIAKHITNNINDGKWPDLDWVRRKPRKNLLKKEIIHFAVDMQDLLQAEYIVKSKYADDPLNMTDYVAPIYRRRPRSEETKRKQSEKMKGRVFTEEHKAKLREAFKKAYAEGRAAVISYHNVENLEKMKAKIKENPYHKNRPKKKCPHCYKVVSINLYDRFHGDNCKNNW